MERKHTPGPWTLYETTNADDAGEFEVDAPDYETVALVYASENLVANAALIAAAPDMYEALRGALAFFENEARRELHDDGEVSGWVDGNRDAIRAALARAEGR